MQIDQKKIELIFRDSSKQPKLEPLCWRILEHFQFPQHSLICIFDDEERPEFTDPSSYGENLCGLFEHVREFHSECPDDLDEYVLENERFLRDVVIYLCYRTCHSPAGMTITFAHELHHFMQYGCEPKAYQANRHLLHISRKYKYDNLPLWDFPHEYQAQLRSKGVAEDVLGVDEIRNYAEQQRLLGNDPEKWKFFLELNSQESFDLLENTKSLANDNMERLRELFPAHCINEPDYTKTNWWE